jgi:hypothetical protein
MKSLFLLPLLGFSWIFAMWKYQRVRSWISVCLRNNVLIILLDINEYIGCIDKLERHWILLSCLSNLAPKLAVAVEGPTADVMRHVFQRLFKGGLRSQCFQEGGRWTYCYVGVWVKTHTASHTPKLCRWQSFNIFSDILISWFVQNYGRFQIFRCFLCMSFSFSQCDIFLRVCPICQETPYLPRIRH